MVYFILENECDWSTILISDWINKAMKRTIIFLLVLLALLTLSVQSYETEENLNTQENDFLETKPEEENDEENTEESKKQQEEGEEEENINSIDDLETRIESETCFGISSTDTKVCSGFGKCIGKDWCSCNDGHSGQKCEEAVSCFGKQSTDATVCGGRGICRTTDTCSCKDGYTGLKCEIAPKETQQQQPAKGVNNSSNSYQISSILILFVTFLCFVI